MFPVYSVRDVPGPYLQAVSPTPLAARGASPKNGVGAAYLLEKIDSGWGPCWVQKSPAENAENRVSNRHDLRTLGDENGRRRGMCRPSVACALFSRFPTTSWWAKISAAPFGAGSTSERASGSARIPRMAEMTFDLSKTNPA